MVFEEEIFVVALHTFLDSQMLNLPIESNVEVEMGQKRWWAWWFRFTKVMQIISYRQS